MSKGFSFIFLEKEKIMIYWFLFFDRLELNYLNSILKFFERKTNFQGKINRLNSKQIRHQFMPNRLEFFFFILFYFTENTIKKGSSLICLLNCRRLRLTELFQKI